MALSQNERGQVIYLMTQSKKRKGKYCAKSTARKAECSERTVWRVWGMYDGTPESLNTRYGNQRPSKREITEIEHTAIEQVIADNPHIGWTQLHGQLVLAFGNDYPRHVNTIRQYCIRNTLRNAVEIKRREPLKPYHTAKMIGYKWQIDHKKVNWIGRDGKPYTSRNRVQYSAMDEGSGEKFIAYFENYGADETCVFIDLCIDHFGYQPIKVQMDNGAEFKNKKVLDRFAELGIIAKFNRPGTPRWNGKIERKHGDDQIWFYNFNHNTDNMEERLAKHLYLCNNATSRALIGRTGKPISPMRMRAERIGELRATMMIIHANPNAPLQEMIYRYWLYKKPMLKHTAWSKALAPKRKQYRIVKSIPNPMPITYRHHEKPLIRSPPSLKTIG